MAEAQKPLFLAHDNKDDRSESHRQLEKLDNVERLAWLTWCCRRCQLPAMVPPDHAGSAMEVWFDFWNLTNDYRLDPELPMRILERMARLPRKQRRQELHQLLVTGPAAAPVPKLAWNPW